jgi:hypothetical protein
MVSLILSEQRLLLSAVLLLGSVGKTTASRSEIDTTGLAALLAKLGARGERSTVAVWRALIAGEALLAFLLIAAISPAWVGGLTLSWLVSAAIYLGWVLRQREQRSCGCFGATTVASRKSIARLGLLATAASLYVTSTWVRLALPMKISVAVLTVEALTIIALSDEIRPSARRLRLAFARLGRVIGLAKTDFALVRRRIEQQPFWLELVRRAGTAPILISAWREGRWFLCEYSLGWHEEEVTVVGAEYVAVHPAWLRIVVFREGDDRSATILAAWDSALAPQGHRAMDVRDEGHVPRAVAVG